MSVGKSGVGVEDGGREFKQEAHSMSKYNSAGLPNCRYCGKAQRNLEGHLKEAHDTEISTYMEDFPEWPTEPIDGISGGSILSFKERQKKMFSVKETFGFWWDKDKDGKGVDKLVQGYEEPGPLTPQMDSGYVFNTEYTSVFLLGLHLHDHILVHGPTGSGKTSLGEQVAARLNFNFMRINFDGGITRPDLVGQWIVRNKDMYFSYGILPLSMLLPGTIICIDEWDAASEECSFVLQRPLESHSELLIMENGEEIITLHPENMIVATSNTAGMGDDTGLYSQGTRIQNYAQLNRFAMTVELNYLPAKEEARILVKRFGKGSASAKKGLKELSPMEADFMVKIVNGVRQAFVKGDLAGPLSTRDLINWCQKYMIWGDMEKAAKFCFIQRMPVEDREVVKQIIKRAFEAAE